MAVSLKFTDQFEKKDDGMSMKWYEGKSYQHRGMSMKKLWTKERMWMERKERRKQSANESQDGTGDYTTDTICVRTVLAEKL